VTDEHVKSHNDVENDIAIAQFAGNEGEPHILFHVSSDRRSWWNGELRMVVSFKPCNEDWEKCLKSVI